jgi:hypothetical protein
MPVPIDWEPVGFTIRFALLAAALLVAGLWWAWWRLPKQEVARLALKIRDPKARADVEDNIRKTVGQGLGGVAVLLGAGLAYLQFSQQQRASHDLLISNQVSKGFEQLGSEKVVVRLGGIYALEGVMNGGGDQYHQPVLEALTAFVREGAKPPTPPPRVSKEPPSPPPTDIQAALTVIGRRSAGPGDVNLSSAYLRGAYLPDANLALADLRGAYLPDANLALADLRSAYLPGVNLSNAELSGADLGRAKLSGANLSGANLFNTDLTRADLPGADLTGARLRSALLRGADLSRANLSAANLLDVQGLDQGQLDAACGSDAVLPKGLTLKPCPPQSSP